MKVLLCSPLCSASVQLCAELPQARDAGEVPSHTTGHGWSCRRHQGLPLTRITRVSLNCFIRVSFSEPPFRLEVVIPKVEIVIEDASVSIHGTSLLEIGDRVAQCTAPDVYSRCSKKVYLGFSFGHIHILRWHIFTTLWISFISLEQNLIPAICVKPEIKEKGIWNRGHVTA